VWPEKGLRLFFRKCWAPFFEVKQRWATFFPDFALIQVFFPDLTNKKFGGALAPSAHPPPTPLIKCM